MDYIKHQAKSRDIGLYLDIYFTYFSDMFIETFVAINTNKEDEEFVNNMSEEELFSYYDKYNDNHESVYEFYINNLRFKLMMVCCKDATNTLLI